MFRYTIFVRIIDNSELSNNDFIIHEELKRIITIFIPVIKLYPLDLLIKLGLDFKIKLHEYSECFSFYDNDFYPDITDEVICEGDEITRLIL